MRIVLCPNPYRDRGLRAARRASDILREAGAETVFCLPFSLETERSAELPGDLKFSAFERELCQSDMLVCFGGDGTILHVARDANLLGLPILGVNLGSLGYMAELESGELDQLARLVSGDYSIEERMMLDVRATRAGRMIYSRSALNDAVVAKGAVARVIELSILGDGEPITDFSGDGVIICTPTGSTAYSMSAGGPVVEPTADNIIVTPICAHALYAKSMVLDGDRAVQAIIQKQGQKTAYLSVDGGKAVRLFAGDAVEVKRAACRTRLVRLSKRNFYGRLYQKLGKV